MSDEVVIKAQGLSKEYPIFQSPKDRLKQMVLPRLQGLLGWPKQKYYHPFAALDDVSFEVRRGESLGIVGRNGSGKSTLLQIIAGTLHPSTGCVQVNGRVAALLELGSGFNPEFTGRENVYLNCSVLGLTREQTDHRFAAIEEFADIGSFIDQPVKTYSSGMTMRLAFAVIAHVDADVLIVDEALSVGDVFFVQKCMRFVRNFQKRGSLLFVTHDTTALQTLCERAVWLEKGHVRETGTAKRISERYLEATYAEKQGVIFSDANLKRPVAQEKLLPQERPVVDQRSQFINASNLRNDIKVFDFNPDSASFGSGGAVIESFKLCDATTSDALLYIVGGEQVVLEISAQATAELSHPIIGFHLRNRLGQPIFAENTYLTSVNRPLRIHPNQTVVAQFRFQMPFLPPGDYMFDAAIASGTQQDHVQHHWLHEALPLRVESSHVGHGLLGIPMHNITISLLPNL